MNKNLIHKNSKDEWYTPKHILDFFQTGLKFDLDVASNELNRSRLEIPHIFTKENSGLVQEWFGKVWCNPPFSLKKEFVDKAIEQVGNGKVRKIFMLLPMSFDTKLFHDKIFKYADRIYIPKGRIKFEDETQSKTNTPNFGSCIIEFSSYFNDKDLEFIPIDFNKESL